MSTLHYFLSSANFVGYSYIYIYLLIILIILYYIILNYIILYYIIYIILYFVILYYIYIILYIILRVILYYIIYIYTYYLNFEDRNWWTSKQKLSDPTWRILAPAKAWTEPFRAYSPSQVFLNSCAEELYWLVVYLPPWKIWKSVGMIIPNIWKNKKCSNPPISVDQPRIFWLGKWYEMIWNDMKWLVELPTSSTTRLIIATDFVFQVCQLPFMMLSKQAVSKMLDSSMNWDCDIIHEPTHMCQGQNSVGTVWSSHYNRVPL